MLEPRLVATAVRPLWLVVCLGIAGAQLLAQRVFEGAENTPLRNAVAGMALEDFDGDGQTDVVATQEAEGQVAVLLNRGGAFAETTRYFGVGLNPVFVTTGDFDSDGTADVLVLNSGSSSVSMLLNDGSGSFRDQRETPVGLNPRAAAVGDFNADGALDAVTSNLASFDMNVLFGDGRGGFTAIRRLRVGDNPHSLTVDDFDGDGALDVVVAHRDDSGSTGTISLFRGNRDGTFGEALSIDLPEGFVPRFVAAGDFDEDGRVDTAVLTNGDTLFLFRNSGEGRFDVKLISEDNHANASFFQGFLTALDFDRDGAMDIVTPLERLSHSGIRVHFGSGKGSFTARDFYLDHEVAAFSAADLDGDGLLDGVAGWRGAPGLGVLPGTAAGRVVSRSIVFLDTNPQSLAHSDLDRDGTDELLVLNSDSILLIENSGDHYSATRLFELPGRSLQRFCASDLDGNDGVELAVTDLVQGSVLILAPGETADRAHELRVPDLPHNIGCGDFDRDGLGDLVVSDLASPKISLLLGPGRLAAEPSPVRTIDTDSPVTAFDIGDTDGDGLEDIVLSTRSELRILFGDGHGEFPRSRSLLGAQRAPALSLHDVDRDGAVDLGVMTGHSIRILYSVGLSNSMRQKEIELGAEVRPLLIRDVDGDGFSDLLTATARSVVVVRGLTNGTFAAPVFHPVGAAPRHLALGNFDSRVGLDCATADFASKSVSILVGQVEIVEGVFRRGDVDLNGQLQITDAVVSLNWLFLDGPSLRCPDAADTDDDGRINIGDIVRFLNHLFLNGQLGGNDDLGCVRDNTPDALPACDAVCQ